MSRSKISPGASWISDQSSSNMECFSATNVWWHGSGGIATPCVPLDQLSHNGISIQPLPNICATITQTQHIKATHRHRIHISRCHLDQCSCSQRWQNHGIKWLALSTINRHEDGQIVKNPVEHWWCVLGTNVMYQGSGGTATPLVTLLKLPQARTVRS